MCELYLRTLSAGTPKILDDSEIATVISKIKTYGQKAPKAQATHPAH